jgi:hypothetical protein
VRAHNTNGYGGYSSLNSAGDYLEGPPTTMNQPLKNAASSTATSLSLTWTALSLDSETGASTILSYLLEYYNTGTSAWVAL